MARCSDVVADDQTLKLKHVNPSTYPRLFADSADPEKCLRPGQQSTSRLHSVKEEPQARTSPAIGDEDIAMSTGSRTPAPSIGGRTPVAANGSTPKHSGQWDGWRQKADDASSKTSENNGWNSGDSTLNGSTASDADEARPLEWGAGGKETEAGGWGSRGKATIVSSDDGWGPAEEPEIALE
jgi:hypothetical protein